MNEYLHDIPEGMRLRTIPGVRSLRLSEKASGAAVYSGNLAISGWALLQTLRRECPEATVSVVAPKPQPPARMTNRPISTEMGKKALGVLIDTGVSYSLAPFVR